MKQNLPITQVERHYHPDERLISETDLKGIVTTANASFCAVAGFSQAELVGKSHNIVRHPDMPPAAFADLWRTIAAGERWMGLVKNRCSNGDHYWVKAFVSPVIQDGQIVRYRSVRKQPTRAEIASAEALYRKVWAGEAVLDTLAAQRREMKLGDRLSLSAQLALLAAWPLLLASLLVAGATAAIAPAILWGALGLGGLVTAWLVRLVYGWVTRPLDELARAVSAFEEGDLSARVAIVGHSRFGQIALVTNRALDGVEVAIADMAQMMDGLARGEFGRRIVATLPGELRRIKGAANRAAEQIESTIAALNRQLEDLAEGRLASREQGLAAAAEGKFREAQENAATAAARLSALLTHMAASSKAMAAGDLTQPIRTEAAGELAALSQHFNAALAELAGTLRTVRDSARMVAEASSEISEAVEEVAAGASNQMLSVDQITTALRESGERGGQIALGTGNASAKARLTLATVEGGRAKMERMVSQVEAIAQSSEQVATITAVIGGIAARTNLLALNAAVEAARAGESGKGFAVVAGEVGKLAITVGQAAKEITALVQGAVAQTQRTTASVAEVSADMEQIERAVRESSLVMDQVAAAMEQQQASLATMGEHAVDLSQIAQGNAASAEELTASASELARIAEATYREVDRFRIG